MNAAARALARLVAARARRRRGIAGAVAGVLALACALLVSSGPLSTQAADEAFAQRLATAPPFAVEVSRTVGGTFAQLDSEVADGFPTAPFGPVRRAAVFARRATADGTPQTLVAADAVPGLAACAPPGPCPALRLSGAGPIERFEALRLDAKDGRAPELLEVANADGLVVAVRGLAAVADWPGLRRVPRRYGWSAAVVAGGVHPWTAAAVADRAEAAAQAIGGATQSRVSTPAEAIRAQARRGEAGGRHVLMVTALIATLLFGFAVLIAGLRRPDVDAERARLAALGARPHQLVAFTALDVLVAVIPGVLAGTAAGVAVALAAGLPPGQLPAATTLLLGVAVSVVAAVVLTATASGGGAWRGRVQTAAFAVVAALGCVGLSRGALDTGQMAAGLDPALVLLPPGIVVVVATVAGAAVRRALPPAARRLLRVSPGSALAVVGLARDGRRAATAAGFLAAATAVALFALTYDATLDAGERDQAAFATGADARELRSAAPPSAPLDERGGWVLRRTATTAGDGEAFELLGAPAAMLPALAGWRDDFSSRSAAEIAEALEPVQTLRLEGVGIGRPEALELPFTLTGSRATLHLALQRTDGRFERLPLATEVDPGRHVAKVAVGPRLAGARIVGVEVNLPLGAAAQAETGTIALGPVRDETGREVTDFTGTAWEGAGTAYLSGAEPPVLSYDIYGETSDLGARVRQPVAAAAVPALLSESLRRRARTGFVSARLADGSRVRLRPVATASHFPTLADGDWAVVDTGRLAAVLNSAFPGAAVPAERWLAGAPGAGTTRAERLAAEQADPLGRRLHLGLAACVLFGAALLVAALAVMTAGAARERRGELVELEAAGLTAGELRRQLHVAALAVAAVAVPAGIAGAVALTAAVTGLVGVTATGADPAPPLVLVLPVGAAVAVLAAVALCAGAVMATGARLALRGRAAGRLTGA